MSIRRPLAALALATVTLGGVAAPAMAVTGTGSPVETSLGEVTGEVVAPLVEQEPEQEEEEGGELTATLDEALDTVEDTTAAAPEPVAAAVTTATDTTRTALDVPDGEASSPAGGDPAPDDDVNVQPASREPTTPVADVAPSTAARPTSDPAPAHRASPGATSLRGFRVATPPAGSTSDPLAAVAAPPTAAFAPPTTQTTVEPPLAAALPLPREVLTEILIATALLVLATAGLVGELGPER